MTQAENYAISGDDFGFTWYWDSVNEAVDSDGYNITNREGSALPNRMRAPSYYDGRLVVAMNSNNLLIGDLIHGGGESDASNLIKFTEQTYWASGQHVALPTEAGSITATYPLPSITSLKNQSGLVIEAEHSSYFLRLDLPREQWGDNQILFLSSGSSGCVGQQAFDTLNNDSVRRTRDGIQRLSFDRRKDELDGSSKRISEKVDDYLNLDYDPDLRFSSLKLNRKDRRMLCTVRPWLSGLHWQHRGMLSFNSEKQIWESLWTLPDWCSRIKQLLPMEVDGESRMLIFCGGSDSEINLVEVEADLREDIDQDGCKKQIKKSVEPRSVISNLRDKVELKKGSLQFSRVKGNVSWSIFWKSDEFPGEWREWASGVVQHEEIIDGVEQSERVTDINLPEFSGEKREGVTIRSARQFDFLIKWEGKADLRFHEFESSRSSGEKENEVSKSEMCLDQDARVYKEDEFEYTR